MRELRRIVVLAGLWALLAAGGWTGQSHALGDVVYMRDGKTYQGKAAREGNKVRIELAHPAGTVIDVDSADVSYITTGPVTTLPDTMPVDTTGPGKDRPFSIERATRPEPVVFMYMQNLSASSELSVTTELRRQLESWQAAAKDRKRQVAVGQWFTPDDFTRCRKSVQATLKEAQDLFKKAKSSYGSTPRAKDERKQAETAGLLKLKLAAQTWADPVLRNFLIGIAEYEAKNYKQAEVMFRLARDESPRVPAFQQGLGMALNDLDRHTDALAVFMELLALEPDSRDALQMARDALKKVPGSDLTNPTYINAKKDLAQYQEPEMTSVSSTVRRTTWLMPGKPVIAYEQTLPIPAYDRFVFRQGVGVPVAEGVLLVDSQVVKDALNVYVQIDSKTLVPGHMKRTSSYLSSKTPLPPLELLAVQGYTFTPVVGKSPPKLTKDQAVKIRSLGIFEEIGFRVRETAATIKDVAGDGTMQLSAWLMPGEGAAPILTEDGQLAGFLTGKTDPYVQGGGPDKVVITLAELSPLLKQAQKGFTSYDFSGGYGKAKRTAATQPATGQCFVIYATVAEKVE